MTMPPPGWYPTPDNPDTKKYWDGEKWLDIPAPDETPKKPRQAKLSKRTKIIIAAAVGVLLITGGSAMAYKVVENNKAAEKAALVEKAANLEAEARAEQAAEKERTEQASRKKSVKEIEDAVKTMAEGHAADRLITGPILEVSCSPLGGGSTDDLTEKTTIFECFVANADNGDGTMNGYSYNATMNWDTGRYTYGIGAP